MNFAPRCFFRKRPIVVGMKNNRDEFGRERSPGISLEAASYNTFSKIGETVVLGRSQPTDDGALPRGVESQADFKRVANAPACSPTTNAVA